MFELAFVEVPALGMGCVYSSDLLLATFVSKVLSFLGFGVFLVFRFSRWISCLRSLPSR